MTCWIWPYKQPISCISLTLSNHMLLTIIYLITHLHVRAGSRPSPPVRRKCQSIMSWHGDNYQAFYKGNCIMRRSALVWTNATESSYFGGHGLFIEEVNTEPEAPALAKFRWIFVWYHRLYTENPPVNAIQSKYNTIPDRFGNRIFFCVCRLVKKGN